jgi:hypothetical protein
MLVGSPVRNVERNIPASLTMDVKGRAAREPITGQPHCNAKINLTNLRYLIASITATYHGRSRSSHHLRRDRPKSAPLGQTQARLAQSGRSPGETPSFRIAARSRAGWPRPCHLARAAPPPRARASRPAASTLPAGQIYSIIADRPDRSA